MSESKKWFGGMSGATARKTLKRWTEENFPDQRHLCGTMYGDYFNYKISKAISVTKRGGTLNFVDRYKKRGYYIVKDIFREQFLHVIKQEILQAEKPSWVYPSISHRQTKSSILKTRLENPNNNGGCVFLHHFLSRVAAGSFPEKTFWEVAILRTEYSTAQKWIPCLFHADLSDAPAEYLDNEKSPITFYFAVDNEVLQLELIPKSQTRGPKPEAKTITLNPGDILLFDTCATVHRTAIPTKSTTPDRLNIVMTGYENFLEIAGDSASDSD
jgi:hypothetical protein